MAEAISHDPTEHDRSEARLAALVTFVWLALVSTAVVLLLSFGDQIAALFA